ncbi:hypothetical protein MUK42_37129 [Musa troglodytarum]|uniref:Uncharacterized protein n=1 Tax=Musa troglodytarum TaxID=320322 RepID=A0A9E7FPU3_9LILI|nr:hypothetical protein MUK42_37129 [Musa troglodytarum]
MKLDQITAKKWFVSCSPGLEGHHHGRFVPCPRRSIQLVHPAKGGFCVGLRLSSHPSGHGERRGDNSRPEEGLIPGKTMTNSPPPFRSGKLKSVPSMRRRKYDGSSTRWRASSTSNDVQGAAHKRRFRPYLHRRGVLVLAVLKEEENHPHGERDPK